ncbi:MAG: hypothetical protein D6752_07205 [Candidatus Nitrosothermus koennekii]|nr:MAG: hypothetical protein D6752_07205 [Candidatus Nitrosothermus koennekii]
MDKQFTIEECMISRLKELLFISSILSFKSSKPIILYRNVMEEYEDIMEEEIASISGPFIIVQVITYGGVIAPSIQQQSIFDLEEFPEWAMNRGKELFQRILSNLESIVKIQK